MFHFHHLRSALLVVVLLYICTISGEDKGKSKTVKAGDAAKPTEEGRADDESADVVTGKISAFDRFKKLFAEHRSLQLNAIKSLQHFADNVQRHKLVEIMLQQLFTTLAQARVNITQWGVLPGDPFPEEESKQESVSKIYENTAMFGDMVLRLPDIVHPMYDKNRDWQMTLNWCVMFCNMSLLFEGSSGTLLNLMAQEVNILPRSPEYVNPFKTVDPKEQKKFTEAMKKQLKPKKKKKIARGPRMSHTEL
ncbi:coiled-coil domain-containing protein 134-like [Haliotis asinina]|uniref:coiled-coil domain-containing protein 134-like n=1 Tax=Haliotis asinina TaxID=109174 RepID=UPI0035320B86